MILIIPSVSSRRNSGLRGYIQLTENLLKEINETIKNTNVILVGKGSPSLKLIKKTLMKEMQTLIVYELSGKKMKSEGDFYQEFYTKIPLIKNPGMNLDAIRDCLLAMECSDHNKKHLLLWEDADVLLKNDADFFYEVMDMILGTIKELTVGDEIDRANTPEEFSDWSPTWVRCIIAGDTTLLQNNYDYSKLKSLFWEEVFFSLDSNTSTLLDGS